VHVGLLAPNMKGGVITTSVPSTIVALMSSTRTPLGSSSDQKNPPVPRSRR